MTYTIEKVKTRQFVEPEFGVVTYFDFGTRLFSTQWAIYSTHILQGPLPMITMIVRGMEKLYFRICLEIKLHCVGNYVISRPG